MKKLLLSALGLITFANVYAQYPTAWPLPTTSNGTSAGYVGLGIKPLSTSTTLPGFDFQVHGISDWIVSTLASKEGEMGSTTNYGKTSRIGLTNSTSGLLSTDGTEIRQSGFNFSISNQETGNMSFNSNGILSLNGNGARLTMQNSKSYFGNSNNYAGGSNALLNIQGSIPNDNGLFIKTVGSSPNTTSVMLIMN